MWLIEFCKRAGELDDSGKALLAMMVTMSFVFLCAVFSVIHKYIERRWPGNDD